MSSDFIHVTQDQGVQTIHINRAAKKNALTVAMYRAMTHALTQAEADDTTQAHLILGAPEVFSAGNDIHDFLSGMGDPTEDEPPVYAFLRCLATLNKPLVAGVNGQAIGIGVTLLLHCDLVVLGESARLKTPFIDLGLCPEAASSLLMPLVFGHQRAAEMLLLGNEIDAHTALNWGLANRVVSPERVAETASSFAHTLAKKPVNALRLSKQLLKSDATASILARMSLEAQHFEKQLATEETQQLLSTLLRR